MSFPHVIREEALVRSGRRCCVCRDFAGRAINVHHIIQEADGGPNTLENSIVLCLRCHSEAGHFNPRHSIGTKYAPSELIRHRDLLWKAIANGQLRPATAELTVGWKRTFITGDLHKHALQIKLTNNADTAITQWKLEIRLPYQVPVIFKGLSKLSQLLDHGVEDADYECRGGSILPGETSQIVGSDSASFEYQMNRDTYHASHGKPWMFAWRFLTSEGVPIEGSRPWSEMHQF